MDILDNIDNEQIVLSPEIQKSMLKFFLRTSIPRKAREERLKKEQALSKQKEEVN